MDGATDGPHAQDRPWRTVSGSGYRSVEIQARRFVMTSTIERALALARGSTCMSVKDIIRRLRSEGYEHVESHLSGKLIRDQLKAAIRTKLRSTSTPRSMAARERPPAPPSGRSEE